MTDVARSDPERAPDRPALAVVIPAFNREATVDRTLASVLVAVDRFEAQTGGDGPGLTAEVIVVDDGSVDDTAGRVARIAANDRRVHLIVQPNTGVSAARNAGARAATADSIAFLDCDDEVDARWLIELIGADRAGPACDLTFCAITRVSTDGTSEVLHPSPLGPAFADVTGLFLPGAFLVDRATFLRVGGYAVALRFSENTELGLRIVDNLEKRARSEGRALTVRTVDEPMATFYLPDGLGHSNAYSDRNRLDSALYIVDVHRDHLRGDPEMHATYWAIAGVAAARLDRGRDAAACFARAVRVQPRRLRHAARVVISLVRPLRRRAWPRSSAVTRPGPSRDPR